MFRADLHCHTTCSDGTFTPDQLVRHAKEIGLSGLSITDHDTIEAYPIATKVAKEVGILLGTGVEFSSVFKEMSVHILGYDFLLDDPDLIAFCKKHEQRRLERNQVILEKLRAHRMPIAESELLARGEKSIGRPHIAQLMVEKGYVNSIKHAFQLYLGDDKPCFYRGKSFSSEETIDIIHQAQGKAFLAHPHLLDHRRKIRELLQLPFDGIECYYARFFPADEKKWIQIATERKMLISGGSDFHGSVKDYIPLGCSWVNQETFSKIFSKEGVA